MNVADVPVKLAMIAEDVTFKLVVTKFPVDVPPANWINCVVTFPCVVTCCKVGVAFPAGQLVPFAKHGNWPPINNDVKLAEVPTMLAANKFVEVELVDTSLVTFKVPMVPFALTKLAILPLMAFTVVPEAMAKPNQPVDVTFVNEPFVAVRAAKFKLVPVALVKINCVEVAADKTAVPPNKLTLFAVRFNAVKLVPEAEAKPSHWVEVTFVKRPLIAFKVVPVAMLKLNQLVVVTLVKVALVPVKPAMVALVKLLLVAVKLVANKLVAVALVKTPVEGVVPPIAVPLIVPPEIAAL